MKKFFSVIIAFAMTVLLFPSAVLAANLTVANNGSAVIPQGSDISADSFKDNTKVTSVTVPDGCAVGNGAFKNCVNLKSVTFEGDVSYIGDEAFLNCTSLNKVTFKKPNASIRYVGKSAFANCFSLETVTLPTKTKEIREFAFGNCILLNTVTLPSGVSAVGSYAVGYMRDEKTGNYFIADGKTEAYISYYRMFNGDLLEWYSPNTGCAVSMNVVKDSASEKYAQDSGIKYSHYKAVEVPEVTASAETDSVVLKWNKVNGADAYRVSFLNNGKFSEYKTTVARICTVDGLESGKSYTFKVSVLNKIKANKYSELISSEEITVTTKVPETVEKKKSAIPEAPSVTAEASTDSITLRWKKVADADAYRVRVYNASTNKYESYKTVYGRSCTVSGLENGIEYRFRVVSLYSVKNKYSEGKSTDDIVISTADIVRS